MYDSIPGAHLDFPREENLHLPTKNDDEVRERLIDYMSKHYGVSLKHDIALLHEPGGLEKLHEKYVLRQGTWAPKPTNQNSEE